MVSDLSLSTLGFYSFVTRCIHISNHCASSGGMRFIITIKDSLVMVPALKSPLLIT